MGHETGTSAACGGASAGQPPVARPAGATSLRSATDGDMGAGERRLLAATPLHAITALHGEAGLRERFAIEIASFPDTDRQRLEQALDLAAALHSADRRQREPYVNHLLRVATRIISHYKVRDADVICAALLRCRSRVPSRLLSCCPHPVASTAKSLCLQPTAACSILAV